MKQCKIGERIRNHLPLYLINKLMILVQKNQMYLKERTNLKNSSKDLINTKKIRLT